MASCFSVCDDSASVINEDQDINGSDDDEGELPVEIGTPHKRPRINLSDCFRSDAMPSEPPTNSNKSYDTVYGHITLSDLLGWSESPESSRSETTSSAPVGGFLALSEVKEWHPNRVWAHVWTNILEVSFPMKTERLRTKQMDWRRYLNNWQTPSKMTTGFSTDALQRVRARDVFKGMVARLTGESWRTVGTCVTRMWARATNEDQFRWHALACSMKEPAIARRTESFQKNGKSVVRCLDGTLEATTVAGSTVKMFEACTGIMLTYNISLGLKSPEVLGMVQDKASPQEFIEFFQQSEFHKTSFDAFWTFLQTLGAKLRFRTIGASMELSENSSTPGRVHFHAYLGTNIQGGTGSMCSIVRSDIVEADLEYQGVKPFPRPTKPKKNHPKTVFDAAVNGLYYVIANKTTSILREATLWHIQDGRDCIGSKLILQYDPTPHNLHRIKPWCIGLFMAAAAADLGVSGPMFGKFIRDL